MSTKNKVTVTLGETMRDYLDKFIEDDTEAQKTLPPRPDGFQIPVLSREQALMFCIVFSFLTVCRSIHPQVAYNLARSMALGTPDEIDATMSQVKADMESLMASEIKPSPETLERILKAMRPGVVWGGSMGSDKGGKTH